MIIAVTAPPVPRRTVLDRLLDGAGRALLAAGSRLADAGHRRVEQRRTSLPARVATADRRHDLTERVRDNAAQIHPLGLR
mgnify:CR=1 FL=1